MLYIGIALLCAGCSQLPWQKSSTTAATPTARKAPAVNLAGFPPPYKDGYSDGCASTKDAKRFKSDKQYAQGWRDGSSICKTNAKPRTVTAGNG